MSRVVIALALLGALLTLFDVDVGAAFGALGLGAVAAATLHASIRAAIARFAGGSREHARRPSALDLRVVAAGASMFASAFLTLLGRIYLW